MEPLKEPLKSNAPHETALASRSLSTEGRKPTRATFTKGTFTWTAGYFF